MSRDRSFVLHILFRIAIAFKGLDGIIETLGGAILLVVRRQSLVNFVHWLFRHELAQDPTDFVANYLTALADHLSVSTEYFAAIYLLAHGLIKVGLVAAMWRDRLWAFPLAGVVLSVIVIYEIYRVAVYHSILLAFLSVVDIVIIVLLRLEYRRAKRLPESGEN